MSAIDRELVEFCRAEELSWQSLALPLGALDGKVLSGRPAAGDGAALVWLSAGWRAPAGAVQHGFELVVLEGALQSGATDLPAESYVCAAAGEPLPALSTAAGALVFVDLSVQAAPGRIVPASEGEWQTPSIPGPEPGLVYKVLRGDPETGPFAFLLRVPPGHRELRTEWHDCAEQCFVLDGDLWHDRANGGAGGTMLRHSYFWRPPHVLHSPMGSNGGVSMYMTVDGKLVNHYVEVEGPPPA